MQSIRTVTMVYRGNRNDIVYHMELVHDPNSGLGNVCFSYGRRGGTQKTGQKFNPSVSLNKAEDMFHEIERVKLDEGYEVAHASPAITTTGLPPTSSVDSLFGPKAEAASDTARSARAPITLPQLLNVITVEEAETYIKDPDWGMQIKPFGERRIISCLFGVDGVETHSFNRKGKQVPTPPALEAALSALVPPNGPFTLDGELVGDTLYVSEALASRKGALLNQSFRSRYEHARVILGATNSNTIMLLPLMGTEETKREEFEAAQWLGRDDVVFKYIHAHYKAGRPNTWKGLALKVKFTESATVRVAGINDIKRSIAIEMCDESRVFSSVGNCTIPTNQPMPEAGAIIEVGYLCAYPDDGTLYQPVYLGRRNDLDESDCGKSQLKYRTPHEPCRSMIPDSAAFVIGKPVAELFRTGSFQ